MYATAGYAKARYGTVDITSKVEGASPHQLVAVLYEELLKTLDTLALGMGETGTLDRAGVIQRRARANSILLGLEGSLDREQGGDLAGGLSAIYREARRLVDAGCAARDPQAVKQAREMIGDIADAWSQIG